MYHNRSRDYKLNRNVTSHFRGCICKGHFLSWTGKAGIENHSSLQKMSSCALNCPQQHPCVVAFKFGKTNAFEGVFEFGRPRRANCAVINQQMQPVEGGSTWAATEQRQPVALAVVQRGSWIPGFGSVIVFIHEVQEYFGLLIGRYVSVVVVATSHLAALRGNRKGVSLVQRWLI